MKIAHPLLVLLLSLPLPCPWARAQAAGAAEQVTDQIVRLSLVQGDVRIARGKAGEHATGGDWGQAQVNLPLLTGFSMVTGDGRAEIELEDASTIYLGEHSVLSFDLLADQGDTPHTVLTLVSGVATLHYKPVNKGETLVLITPASRLALQNGAGAFLRVDSFVNATRYVSLATDTLRVDRASEDVQKAGQPLTYYADGRVDKGQAVAADPEHDPEAAWDTWTRDRVLVRDREMAAAMRDSGLREPLPGLSDLEQHGRFFPCAPYGTCWVPSVPGGPATTGAKPARLLLSPRSGSRARLVLTAHSVPARYLPAQFFGSGFGAPYGPYGYLYSGYPFPCIPGGITGIAWLPGQTFSPYSAIYGNAYDWTLCHAGSWIPRTNGYAWVVSEHKHHHCPVRWVKANGKTGFVPLHPGDEPGKPPLNLDHGVFFLESRTTLKYERVAGDGAGKPLHVKAMDDPPREFRSIYYPVLRAAAAPDPVAHALSAGTHGRPVELAAAEPIRIGRHADEFSITRQEPVSGHERSTVEHFGGSAGVARAAGPGFSGIRGGFTAAHGSSFSEGTSTARAASVSAGGGASGHEGGGSGGSAGSMSHGGGSAGSSGSAGGGGHH